MRNIFNFKNLLLSLFFIVFAITLTSFITNKAYAANYPSPEWWNGNITSCDPVHHGGSYMPTPTSIWSGLASCYPRPGTDVYVSYTRGGNTIGAQQLEWECTELVERYMFLAWGIKPYGAYGAQIVSAWNSSVIGITPIDISNGNSGHNVPAIGDVLSFGTRGSAGGHTAIVTDVRQLSGTGNYGFTIFQQNATNAYDSSDITMSNWNMSANGYDAINGWLHQQQSRKSPSNMTAYMAGINPPSGVKQVFTIDTKGQIVTSWQCSGTSCPGGWANWQEENPGTTRFPTTAHLSAVMNQAGSIEVFGTDVNGNFWHMWGSQGSWSALYSLDGGGGGDITAANWDNSNDMVLWITSGDNNNPFHPFYRYSQNGNWTAWTPYSNATFAPGTRYVFGKDSSSINIFALGLDGKIYANYTPWGLMNWSSAFFVFGDLNNGVGFSSDASTTFQDNNGDEEVVAPRTDGTVWHDYESGGSFQGWTSISSSPKIRNTVAAVQTNTLNPEFYTRDVNYNVFHNWNTGCGNCYSGWNPFSANIPFSTDPNAIDNSSHYPEFFEVATDGTTYHQWLNPGSWSGWQVLSSGETG